MFSMVSTSTSTSILSSAPISKISEDHPGDDSGDEPKAIMDDSDDELRQITESQKVNTSASLSDGIGSIMNFARDIMNENGIDTSGINGG